MQHLNALNWFEIPVRDMSRAVGFYEMLLGTVWTLAAWCEERAAFRSFRIDRVQQLDVLPEAFRDEEGKTLADLFRATAAERGGWQPHG